MVVSGSNHEGSMRFAAGVTCRTTVLCSALLTLHNANDVCRQSGALQALRIVLFDVASWGAHSLFEA